jgi:hypothetical protein
MRITSGARINMDVMAGQASEGVIRIGRYDANTSRYNEIQNSVTSTGAGSYMNLSVHSGTENVVTDVMTLLGNGKVGIGITAPGAILDIARNATKTNTGSSEIMYIGTSNEASNYATLQVYTEGAAAAADRKWMFQTIEQGIANAGNIVLQPSGGNVGIGLITPGAKLDVLQEARVSFANSNQYTLRITNTDGNPRILADGSAAHLIFGTTPSGSATATERVRIQNDGNVGIGTTTPDALLSTADTNAYTQEWKYAKGYRHFTTSPTSSSGNYNISTKISVNNLRGLCVDYYESGHLYNNGAAYYFRHTRLYIMMEGSTLRINDAVLIQNTGNRTDAIVNAPAVTTNATLECLITSTIKSGFTHYVSADIVGSGFNKIKSIS